MFILSDHNSIANQYLAEIRDAEIQKDRWRFRKNMEYLGLLMAYEMSKALPYKNQKVKTPLGVSNINVLAEQPILVPILRAAIPFYQGVLNVFDKADSGFIGAYRKVLNSNHDFDINTDYMALPDITGRHLVLIDPMLASGKSIVKTMNDLVQYGKPSRVDIMVVIAAPEGIAFVENNLSIDYSLWVGAVDERLDERSYIIPGLGDAGDLAFGEKI